MSDFKYDIAIIGGGPGGYVAASYATQFGKKVILFEKDKLGGNCLNVGCIPTKILAEAANRFKTVALSGTFGVKTKGVSFDWMALSSYSGETRRALITGVYSLMKRRGVDVIPDNAKISDKHTIIAGGIEYTTKNIIIATGSQPTNAPFKNRKIITSDEFWNLDHKPDRLLVVGGGVIGCEISSAMSRLGTKVYVVEMLPRLLSGFSDKAVQMLTNQLQEDNVDIYCGESVKDIYETEENLTVETEKQRVDCDYVLWAAGRKPVEVESSETIDKTEKDFVKVDVNYRTNNDNIYCIGDANGISMLAHSAIAQGMRVVEHICSGQQIEEAPYIPQCVFTSPAIARIGLDSDECRKLGMNIVTGTAPYIVSGYSRAVDESNGYYHVVRDVDTDRIVGAEIVGYEAFELIHILAPYVNKEIPARAMSDLIIAHPTLSEGIKIAIESSYTRSPQM